MPTLQDILNDPSRRTAVVDDCAQLVDDEVGAKGGLSGMAIKGVYMLVKKIKPGFIRGVVDHLLDAFVAELEPFYKDFLAAGGGNLQLFLQARAAAVASALLQVTDRRIDRADNGTIRSGYAKLRPSAAKHVETAVPGIGRILSKYSA